MRLIFGLVLIVGLGLAGFAVYMAKDYIGSQQAALARERAAREQMVATVDVVVVNRALRYGEEITQKDVRTVRWPEDAIPEGTFAKLDDVFPFGSEKLRKTIRAIEKDEALMLLKVTEPGQDAGVSSRLTKGMRAFAIRVDVSTGVSGFLRPGDRVDIYWSGRIASANADRGQEEVTQLIESGVRLIAIDQMADEDRTSPTIARTVTVEATPLQVASLAQAQNTGNLSLSLLGAEDEGLSEDVAVNQSRLLGLETQQLVEVQEQKVCTIRTRRGAETIETPIPCTN